MWKVLIVDDEPKIRRGLAKWIEEFNLGYKVIGEANNYIEALEIAENEKPDLFLVDINMPKVNGLDLTRQLKNKYPKAYIVIISGYDDFEYARQALKLQVFDYLLKPVPKTDFYHIMKTLRGKLSLEYESINDVNEELNKINILCVQEKDISAIVLRVKNYIDNNYSDPELTLIKVSNLFNINKTYLSKLMKEQLGYSFTEYMTEVRMSKAKELLNTEISQVKMYEIAKKVGFRSQHYFSRVFKNNQGMSPLEFRNKV